MQQIMIVISAIAALVLMTSLLRSKAALYRHLVVFTFSAYGIGNLYLTLFSRTPSPVVHIELRPFATLSRLFYPRRNRQRMS